MTLLKQSHSYLLFYPLLQTQYSFNYKIHRNCPSERFTLSLLYDTLLNNVSFLLLNKIDLSASFDNIVYHFWNSILLLFKLSSFRKQLLLPHFGRPVNYQWIYYWIGNLFDCQWFYCSILIIPLIANDATVSYW